MATGRSLAVDAAADILLQLNDRVKIAFDSIEGKKNSGSVICIRDESQSIPIAAS